MERERMHGDLVLQLINFSAGLLKWDSGECGISLKFTWLTKSKREFFFLGGGIC